jgi:hypothetical protein
MASACGLGARASPGISGGRCVSGKKEKGEDGALAGGDSRSEGEREGRRAWLGDRRGAGPAWLLGRAWKRREESRPVRGEKEPAQGKEKGEGLGWAGWALFPLSSSFLFLFYTQTIQTKLFEFK